MGAQPAMAHALMPPGMVEHKPSEEEVGGRRFHRGPHFPGAQTL